MTGRVVSLQVVPEEHQGPRFVDEARALPGEGIEGDWHRSRARPRRSVLVTHVGDLRDVGISPGDLREQITLDLPGLMDLDAGTRLEVGPAILEITKECAPCLHIGEHVLGGDAREEDREKLRDALEGRRGMLAQVLEAEDHPIRVGDPVEVLA